MAETLQTDANSFRRSSHCGKTSRRQNRSEESKASSNWFDRTHSNVSKRSNGSNQNMERCQRSNSNAVNCSAENAEKNSTERNHLKHKKYTNNEKPQNEKRHLQKSGEKTAEHEHSDEGDSRGFRKKMASDGVKRLKTATAKKDSTWRQNSRSRRLVANARERSRIHILSDAFENLRRAVPSYSKDQKLSKLAILKLATYYISALANLAESDTSARSLKQFADCVAHCTKALQTEGRSRRKQF